MEAIVTQETKGITKWAGHRASVCTCLWYVPEGATQSKAILSILYYRLLARFFPEYFKWTVVAKRIILEKKWRKTEHGVKVEKKNEYFSNLPSQNRSDSGGSCAFWSVRTWNVLFVESSGVEFSFPSFLSVPSSSTHHHLPPPHFTNLAINGSYQGLSIS